MAISAIPFQILVLYIGIALTIGILGIVLGIKKTQGSPMMMIFAGIMIFALIVLVTNITVDYRDNFTYTLDYPMNVTTGSTAVSLNNINAGISEHAININSVLYNKQITCIRVDMAKTGAPTGSFTVGILGDDLQIVKSFGTQTASSLITLQRSFLYCLPNHDYWTLSLYDRVGVFYNTGTATDFISVYVDSSSDNVFDGANSKRSTLTVGGTWTDATGDVHMQLLYDKPVISATPTNYNIQSNDTYAYLIVLSVFFVLMGVLFQLQKWT